MLLKGTFFHLGEKACFRSRTGGRAGEENLELSQPCPAWLWDRRLGFSASPCRICRWRSLPDSRVPRGGSSVRALRGGFQDRAWNVGVGRRTLRPLLIH